MPSTGLPSKQPHTRPSQAPCILSGRAAGSTGGSAGAVVLPPDGRGVESTMADALNVGQVSLRELGEALEPPLTRSGVNHRMQKLLKLAQMPD